MENFLKTLGLGFLLIHLVVSAVNLIALICILTNDELRKDALEEIASRERIAKDEKSLLLVLFMIMLMPTINGIVVGYSYGWIAKRFKKRT